MPISVGPASESMPTTPAQQPLGGGDVDVARPHDQVGRLAVVGAVGEHRDRLGAADRVHLVDAEQRAGREHDRVRQAVVVPLRRARDGQRPDAGDLGGHDVHHDARRVGDQPARHVEPDPAYGHPALGDGAARRTTCDVGVLAALRLVHRAGPGGRPPPGRLVRPGPAPRGRRPAPRAAPGSSPRRPGRSRWVHSRTASAPRSRTSSQIGRTTSRATSTSSAARGSTSR